MPEKKSDKYRKIWGKIVARAWIDEVFKQRLLKHPEEVFKEYKIKFDEDIKHIKVHENTKDTVHLTLVQRGKLSDEELKKLTGGISDDKLADIMNDYAAMNDL